MAKSHVMFVLAAALLLAVTGCASINKGVELDDLKLTEGGSEPIAHINGSNWGIYFLPMLPILTGDSDKPGSGISAFSDTVTVGDTVHMVTREAKELGATKITDLRSDTTSFFIPPFFWYKSVQVSGNALK